MPVVEVGRLGLEIIHGTGIAGRGPVRSILLICRKPPSEIQTLAADASSRTSVMLARIILAELHGVIPRIISMPPDLNPMLEAADAALIIGDPALRLDPTKLPWQVLDLGDEWTRMTGKSMVFAVWAGSQSVNCRELEPQFSASCRYGIDHMDEIVRQEPEQRGLPADLVREYLTHNVINELGDDEYSGMELFLQYVSKIGELLPAK